MSASDELRLVVLRIAGRRHYGPIAAGILLRRAERLRAFWERRRTLPPGASDAAAALFAREIQRRGESKARLANLMRVAGGDE